ncbi:MAG: type II toxin-antitoxin system HicB family antitoxin [Candidatus Accumulibacter sp.]|jgi:predicted RNase H-like HicB family nuclease|nr:type II toxin-antitoxin system HicB family antitoxin [Accumulibacter sp.]
MRFPVVLHSDDGVRFGVTVPDLPGCFSAGDSFDAALDSVVEAIDLHLEGIVEDGGDVPVPRAIADHRDNPDFALGVWAVVEIDASRFDGRAEKINITLPRRLLAKIDSCAKAHGATRSGFLADAARAALHSGGQKIEDRI